MGVAKMGAESIEVEGTSNEVLFSKERASEERVFLKWLRHITEEGTNASLQDSRLSSLSNSEPSNEHSLNNFKSSSSIYR